MQCVWNGTEQLVVNDVFVCASEISIRLHVSNNSERSLNLSTF